MNMAGAAVAAILAGIAVAGLIWYTLGVLDNLAHTLKQRAKNKPAPESPPPEEKK